MSKPDNTQSLDEALNNFSKYGLEANWYRDGKLFTKEELDSELEYQKGLTRQAILQWVADEVIGKDIDPENYGWKNWQGGAPKAINVTLDEQRNVLKSYGWKEKV